MHSQSEYDLIIVGGGINGAGIARDAAGRGLKVLLCEMNDLASATSSASTKLIHGGLRYLEHYEFRLVREALTEREVLLGNAPHIIWPLRFVLPHVPGLRPAWMIRLGLFLYDHLGGRKKLPGSKGISLSTHVAGQPLKAGMDKAFVYSDCWVDDARLVVLNAMDARECGADILTRTKCVAASQQDGKWQVTLQGRDDDAERVVTGKMLINAAGPWCASLIDPANGATGRDHIRLVKGSHIVAETVRPRSLPYFPKPMAASSLPFPIKMISPIGTTDVDFTGDPAKVEISGDEVDYLCKLIGDYFATPISAMDVVWSYSGVRPLYAGEGEVANASKVSRDYTLKLEANKGKAPALHVFGGKITTYRKLAEHALQLISKQLGVADRPWTATETLPGGDLPNASFDDAMMNYGTRYGWLPEAMLKRLVRAYGSRIEKLLDGCNGVHDLGINYGHDLYEAEVRYLIDQEWVFEVEDLVWRRSKLGLRLSGDQIAVLRKRLASAKPNQIAAQ
ncbi:glycerol-3-phosphate dehydrogenase [Thalassospira alkalitolerans]|uniref:glycerol-3-phosphate dehydrogenase n=1 Tax=Thalassospira alkalitolerans TaxID=1293890 RepID=UPI003AA84D75